MKKPNSMDECDFFTNRILEDNTKLYAWIPKEQNIVNVIYTCGNCGFKGELSQKYEKPITFICEDCGEKIVVKPLKKGKRGRKKKKK